MAVDYQLRALGFAVGDVVVPYGKHESQAGRIMALHPAIGMAEVEFPQGSMQLSVDTLQRYEGGAVVPPWAQAVVSRVASAHMQRTAIYWAAQNRRYRATKGELEAGVYYCPKCKKVPLRKSSYKKEDGRSVKLFACGSCLFLLRANDLEGIEG